MQNIFITKYSGEKVAFNPDSLKSSLTKSGASEEQVNYVFNQITQHLYDGITTRKLYQIAFKLLKRQRNVFAARYSLKKALRDLGPAGYYFEKWVARVFMHYGYQTLTGKILQGKAVTHEVDVIAQKPGRLIFAECKFRNTVDARISVTTPMYFLSRIKDLSEGNYNFFNEDAKLTDGFLVTNAYLTKDAISFAECYNIGIISWDYPQNNSLKLRVDKGALYPITCLTTISAGEKERLLQADCMLVKDIVEDRKFIESLKCSNRKYRAILEEAEELVSMVDQNHD